MLVPKLRFKDFTDEWKCLKFKEVATLFRGSSPRPIVNFIDRNNAGVNWIKIGDVSETSKVITKTKENITIEGSKKSRKVFIDDIILSNSMSFGRPYILKIDGCIHDGWFVIRNYDNKLIRNYFYYYLSSPIIQKQYKTLSAGGVVSNISSDLVYSTNISFPIKKEQEKIADMLSLLDKKIELQTEKIEVLKLYNKGLFQHLFSSEINYKNILLGDICCITTGKLDANAMDQNGIYRFYTCASNYCYINEYAFDTEALLISGNGANVGYIHYYKGKFNAYQRTYVLHNFKENIQYIKCFLDKYLRKRISLEKKEGNTPYIVISTLSNMNIMIPVLSKQIMIVNISLSIEKKLLFESNYLKKLNNLKKGLMQNMFV